MKLGVFGDIHSDYEALELFFSRAEKDSIEKFICIGDIVHHNSPQGRKDSERTIRLLMEHNTEGSLGNHEYKLLKLNPDFVSKEALEYLANMQKSLVIDDIVFFHESPGKRWTIYPNIKEFEYLKEHFPNQRIAFYGHTHRRTHFELNGTRKNRPIKFDETFDLSKGLHIINPGTVDFMHIPWGFQQTPSYVTYDTEKKELVFRKIR